MKVLLKIVTAGCFLTITQINLAHAQEVGEQSPQNSPQASSDFPLEVVIRPRQSPKGDGYYANGRVNTIYGQELRLSGYHLAGAHRRMVDGKIVYDVWQSDRNLLTYNIFKEVGLLSLPSFEERLAHDLVYGSNIGEQMGGVYKGMSLLEIGYLFNFDPTPMPGGYSGKGILGERKITQDYSFDQMVYGVIDFSSGGDR